MLGITVAFEGCWYLSVLKSVNLMAEYLFLILFFLLHFSILQMKKHSLNTNNVTHPGQHCEINACFQFQNLMRFRLLKSFFSRNSHGLIRVCRLFFRNFYWRFVGSLYIGNAKTERGEEQSAGSPLKDLLYLQKDLMQRRCFFKKTLQKNKRKLKIFFYPSSSHWDLFR